MYSLIYKFIYRCSITYSSSKKKSSKTQQKKRFGEKGIPPKKVYRFSKAFLRIKLLLYMLAVSSPYETCSIGQHNLLHCTRDCMCNYMINV